MGDVGSKTKSSSHNHPRISLLFKIITLSGKKAPNVRIYLCKLSIDVNMLFECMYLALFKPTQRVYSSTQYNTQPSNGRKTKRPWKEEESMMNNYNTMYRLEICREQCKTVAWGVWERNPNAESRIPGKSMPASSKENVFSSILIFQNYNSDFLSTDTQSSSESFCAVRELSTIISLLRSESCERVSCMAANC